MPAAPGGVHHLYQPVGRLTPSVYTRMQGVAAAECMGIELLCAYRSIRRGSTERAHGAVGKKLPAGRDPTPTRKHQSARHRNMRIIKNVIAAANNQRRISSRGQLTPSRGCLESESAEGAGPLWLHGAYGFFSVIGSGDRRYKEAPLLISWVCQLGS